jgi:hypothetical protein
MIAELIAVLLLLAVTVWMACDSYKRLCVANKLNEATKEEWVKIKAAWDELRVV